MLISSISPINSLVSGVAQLLDLPDPLFHIPGSGCAKKSVTSRMIQDIKFGCYGLPKFRAVPQTKTGSSVKNIPIYKRKCSKIYLELSGENSKHIDKSHFRF